MPPAQPARTPRNDAGPEKEGDAPLVCESLCSVTRQPSPDPMPHVATDVTCFVVRHAIRRTSPLLHAARRLIADRPHVVRSVDGVMKTSAVLLTVLTFFSFAFAAAARAQTIPGQSGPAGAGPAANAMPAMLKGITIQQKLNTQIPLELHFRDETGRDVTLRQYFTDRPVILNLVYFQCAMLCPQVVEGLARSLKQLTFEAGRQYTVLTVSFDPRDTPAVASEKKAIALKALGESGATDGWHVLTGDEPSIRQLTDAVGFVYRWDPASRQFFHAAGIMVLTPEGRLSRYFYGIGFDSADLRLGLVEASHNRIGSVVDAILLFCCRYDASTGRYDWLAGRLLSLAGLLTIAILATFVVILSRSEPNHPRAT